MTDSTRHRVFQAFKYGIYGLLVINLAVFFRTELAASEFTFANGLSWSQWFEAYSATIDTAAWIVLLFMFELETAVVEDKAMEGALGWVLPGIRGLCYLFILFAFYGYSAKTATLYDHRPLPGSDPCQYVDGVTSYIVDLDEYLVLDESNCRSLVPDRDGTPLHVLNGPRIIADTAALTAAIWLAWTDVVNAGAWILVVLVLEIDVWLQLHGIMFKPVLVASRVVKAILYLVLLAAAIYWGTDGDFVDFWDAFLWLVSFFFIEMNMVNWRHETGDSALMPGAVQH